MSPRKQCEVKGCGRPHHGRGLCLSHLQRVRRVGSAVEHVPIGATLRDLAASASPKAGR